MKTPAMRKVIADAIGGEGYREWLGEQFEPGSAAQLQSRFDKLCADLERDLVQGIKSDALKPKG